MLRFLLAFQTTNIIQGLTKQSSIKARECSLRAQRRCLFDSTTVCLSADWIHDAVAGWRGPNLTETPDLVPFDQPQQGVLLQLQEPGTERQRKAYKEGVRENRKSVDIRGSSGLQGLTWKHTERQWLVKRQNRSQSLTCYQADSSYFKGGEAYFLAYRGKAQSTVTVPHPCPPPPFLFWESCGCYNGWQLCSVNPSWLSAVGAGTLRPDQQQQQQTRE